MGDEVVEGRRHWEAMRMADEDHGSIVLRSHYAGLRRIFDGWHPSIEAAHGAGGLRKHYDAWSQRLGYKVRPAEAIVNAVGYGAMQQGKLPQALELFEVNVQNYPESANALDSLGEALEAAGKLEQALARYEQAVLQGERTTAPSLTVFIQHRDEARARLKQGGDARH